MGKVIIDRRFARQCDVPGCRSRDTVRVRRIRGYSEQLFLCKNCISEINSLVFPVVESITEQEGADNTGDIAEQVANEKPKAHEKSAASKKKGVVKA